MQPEEAREAASKAPQATPDQSEVGREQVRSAISNYLSTIGRRGGLKGGKARAARLSAKRRKEIAEKAAAARWAKRK